MSLKSKILSALPLDKIIEMVSHLLAGGADPEEIVDEVVAILDDLVDWTNVLPPPFGAILDRVDSPVLRGVVHLIVASVKARHPKS